MLDFPKLPQTPSKVHQILHLWRALLVEHEEQKPKQKPKNLVVFHQKDKNHFSEVVE